MLNQEWLNTFGALGAVESVSTTGSARWRAIGGCVFVSYADASWLVTAGHVIKAAAGKDTALRLNVGDSVQLLNLTDLHRRFGLNWIRHDTDDIGATLLPSLEGVSLRTIPAKLFLGKNIDPTSMRCYIGGCPLGLPGVDPQRAMPLLLDGIVSGMDTQSRHLFLSTPTFPGNSGGPIIVERPPYSASGDVMAGIPTLWLAGIVTETATIRGSAEEAGTAGVSLRLGVGIAIDAVSNLLEGEEAKQQLARIKPPS